jgi:nicotinamide mononucleotide (NMN) deamidase PncC
VLLSAKTNFAVAVFGRAGNDTKVRIAGRVVYTTATNQLESKREFCFQSNEELHSNFSVPVALTFVTCSD